MAAKSVRVDIANRQKELAVPRKEIRRCLQLAAPEEWRGAALSVVVVGSDEMTQLNRRFTGREGDTDVLAFPLDDDRGGDERQVGEIVVSASRAAREAGARGVEPRDELLLYVVHGVLHLLGYDDHSPEQQRDMYEKEASVLDETGVAYVRYCGERSATRPSRRKNRGNPNG